MDIYVENADKSKGKLVSELVYPKIRGCSFEGWETEAVGIAKQELEKSKTATPNEIKDVTISDQR